LPHSVAKTLVGPTWLSVFRENDMLRTWAIRLAIAASLVLSLPGATLAQDQGGGIQGVVRDASKAVLPGVVVEARSPSMPGVATAVSDAQGVYRFPSLRPGAYGLVASLSGFTPVKLADVIVRLGTEFRIDIVMEVASLAETVQVTGETPVIDVRQNAAISTLTDETLDLLPAKGRNFTDFLTTQAGVQTLDGGNIGIDGASGLENHYIVDGLKTTAILSGQSAQPVRMDFVEEIQVKSSGYTAEHGASMGGVINIITKSGGDVFHGLVGTYFEDPNFRWNGRIRQDTRFNPVDNRTPETFIDLSAKNTKAPEYEFVGDIGGPILKQRYWFYLSNSTTHQPEERSVIFSRTPEAGRQTFTRYDRTVRTGYTVTGGIMNNLRMRVTGIVDRHKERRTLPSLEPDGITSLTNPATRFDLTGEDAPKNLATATFDYVITPRLFVNSKVGYGQSNQFTREGAYLPELRHNFSRSNIGLEGVPSELQFPSGYLSTPLSNSGRVREKLTRVAWDLSGTYYGAWKGQHAIKAGFNSEWVSDDIFDGATAPNINLFWNTSFATPDNRAVRGPFGYYSVTQNGSYGEVTGNNFGVFVQDTWQPTGRLTINAGIRTERELIPSYIPANPDLTFGFGDKIAPRVGFAWDIKGDARWKAYGSYGAFFDIMKLRIARFHFGGEVRRTFFYSLDTANWPGVRCQSAGPSESAGCPGTYFGFSDERVPVNAAGESRLDPNVKPSRTKEYVLGLDHELNKRTSVGIRYVHKPLDRLVEDVGLAEITPTSFRFLYTICNPGFGQCHDTMGRYQLPDGRDYPLQPESRREYDAVELRLSRRVSAAFFVNGSYTWSYLRGNTTGLGNEDIAENTLPSLTSQYDTIFMAYDAQGNPQYGRLPNDRPHVFKMQGGYTLPWGTSIAVDYLIQSGELESTTISQRSRYTFINNRADLGRVNPLSRTDLRLQHDFRLFGTQRINVAVDVRNLFDQMAVTDIGHQPYRDGFTIPDGVYFAPDGFDIDAYVTAFRAAAGDPEGLRNLRDNAFYGQPQGWQGRRTIQFSAKFRF
jgi:hypothetical protein